MGKDVVLQEAKFSWSYYSGTGIIVPILHKHLAACYLGCVLSEKWKSQFLYILPPAEYLIFHSQTPLVSWDARHGLVFISANTVPKASR